MTMGITAVQANSRMPMSVSTDSGVRFRAAEYNNTLKAPMLLNNLHPADPVLGPLVGELGRKTVINKSTGMVQLNKPLVEQIARYREQAVEPLAELLEFSNSRRQVVEGLYTAQRLAETGTRNLNLLYAVVADRFKNTKDAWLQTYIAGFYRALKEPSATGHLLQMLSQNKATQSGSMLNPAEEIGGTLLELVSDQVAKKLQRQFAAQQAYSNQQAQYATPRTMITVSQQQPVSQAMPAVSAQFPAIA